MYDIIATIVAYKNQPAMLARAMESFLSTSLNVVLYVVDNSPDDSLRSLCVDSRVRYKHMRKNVGFGAGHNEIIRISVGASRYYLAMNPDIYFETGTLESLCAYMDAHESIGLIMPKVLYPDGSVQHLSRLLPTPVYLWCKRIPFGLPKRFIERMRSEYELRFWGYDTVQEIPYLSGCFMFVRNDIFKRVGWFDERFFMYMEDVDLSRRIHRHAKTVYYPYVNVYHTYEKASAKRFFLLLQHIVSACRYFSKWGFLIDVERDIINRTTLARCGYPLVSDMRPRQP